jgi:hypothetical protein
VTAKNVTVSVRNTPQQAWSAGASMPLKYPRQ